MLRLEELPPSSACQPAPRFSGPGMVGPELTRAAGCTGRHPPESAKSTVRFLPATCPLADQPVGSGFPTSDELPVTGGRESDFQGGRVYWSPATGAHEVHGAILARYLSFGGPTGWLGFPTSDELPCRPGGRESDFQGGRVYWLLVTGAHEVHGAILARYLSFGGPTGWLGFPTSDELPVTGGRESDFQGGRVYWSPATVRHVDAVICCGTPLSEGPRVTACRSTTSPARRITSDVTTTSPGAGSIHGSTGHRAHADGATANGRHLAGNEVAWGYPITDGFPASRRPRKRLPARPYLVEFNHAHYDG